MTVAIANASSNWTGAATFAAAETSSLALARQGTTATISNNSSGTSSSFTVANGAVIDGVVLFLKQSSTGSTGTFKVDLQKGGVSQASVTVNRADLPASANANTGIPVFFKFTSTATGDGGSNWTLVLTCNAGTNAVVLGAATSTSTNYTRALRTTTARTLAAADDVIICKELTGAGTSNSRTVTMDNTNSTQFGSGTVNSTAAAGGGIHVGFGGTLSYGTSASTNYQLKLAGDLIVWEGGTFNMGTSGTPVPGSSTALLNFVPTSTDGDFGLVLNYNYTCSIYGSPRTSGKNVVQCKLTADTGTAPAASGGSSPTFNAATNGTNSTASQLDATGTTLSPAPMGGGAYSDNVTSGNHGVSFNQAASITAITQMVQVWLKAGSGTNKRFMRLQCGNAIGTLTNGFYADIDLQSGTIGSCTAVGNGTATSSSIVAYNGGYVCTIIGKASSAAQTPVCSVMSCSAAGTISYAGDGTQAFIYSDFNVWSVGSATTSFPVDTDTGWLAGDVIAIAGTSRTQSDCSLTALSSNATSSTLPVNTQPWTAYSGTSPLAGEIILLTRNVKLQSNSQTLTSYVYANSTGTLTVSWAEFWNMSTNTSTKQGLYLDGASSGSAGARSVTYCSFHDGHSSSITLGNSSGSNSANATIQNNVFWNSNNFATGPVCLSISGAMTLTDWTIDTNTIVHSGGNGATLADVGGTFTNNVITNSFSGGLSLTETNATLGTFTGNSFKSNASTGLGLNGPISGTFTTTNASLNAANGGVVFGSNGGDWFFDGITTIGNATNNFFFSGTTSAWSIRLKDLNAGGYSGASGTLATTNNFNIATNFSQCLYIDNMDSSASGVRTAASTNEFVFSAVTAVTDIRAICRNAKFGAATIVNSTISWLKDSYVCVEKYGQTAGDNRTWMKNGTFQTDTSIYNNASPSQKLTPSSASAKLESAPRNQGIQVAVANGGAITAFVNIRKSNVGDGAAYNGNQPRLIARANPAIGINSDIVVATYASGTGSFNQISGSTPTATDDGVIEFVVDLDGTAGFINVDDWSFQ